MSTLKAENVTLRYGGHVISEKLSVSFEKPEIVSIIGPNGAGKSTLLKALARILKPVAGTVYLDGKDIHRMASAETARTMAMLAQSLRAPEDMTVRDLVSCGRIPYRDRFSSMGDKDRDVISSALEATGVTSFSGRYLRELSGGERQRVWLAMALAQEPKILLLDEPTTYLDIRHQLELMELIETLHETWHMTVIMVLHDLSHAARFSHRVIAMKAGRIVHDGPAEEVMTEANLEDLYGVQMVVTHVEKNGKTYPVCFPCGKFETKIS